jgi:hypothetical protein
MGRRNMQNILDQNSDKSGRKGERRYEVVAAGKAGDGCACGDPQGEREGEPRIDNKQVEHVPSRCL